MMDIAAFAGTHLKNLGQAYDWSSYIIMQTVFQKTIKLVLARATPGYKNCKHCTRC